jgi:hypothetical protein
MPVSLLSSEQRSELFRALQERFEAHTLRHPHLIWSQVQEALDRSPEKLFSLYQMEMTGGEPDVIVSTMSTGEYMFYDCSPESPLGRRSLCYDHTALEARKEHRPKDSVENMATVMGVEVLTEDEYRYLQTFGKFDTKTSSWIRTPADIRDV